MSLEAGPWRCRGSYGQLHGWRGGLLTSLSLTSNSEVSRLETGAAKPASLDLESQASLDFENPGRLVNISPCWVTH